MNVNSCVTHEIDLINGLIFVKIRAKMQAHFQQKYGRSTSEIMGKIQVHRVHRACMWFTRLIVSNSTTTLWMCAKSQKHRQNHENAGITRAIFHKCLYIRAIQAT